MQCDDPANIINFVNTLRHGKNPQNENGVYSKCVECRATTHWVNDCPDKSVQYVNIEPAKLETLNSDVECGAVISSGVSSTVCGWDWLTSYLDSLPPSVKSEIKWSENSRCFSFRNGGDCPSTHTVDIPVTIGKRKSWNIVRTHVVNRPVPLLLSRSALKWGRMKIDSQNNSAIMYGQVTKLHIDASGYLTMPLYRSSSVTNVGLVQAGQG